ncbi:NAD(P)-binding protein [Agrocybe pediades]|nr:NAD(P)-binding protein [Agrocybe pediades]
MVVKLTLFRHPFPCRGGSIFSFPRLSACTTVACCFLFSISDSGDTRQVLFLGPYLPFFPSFCWVITTNLKSAFLLSQAVGAHMLSLPSVQNTEPGVVSTKASVRSIIHFASLLSFQGGLTVPAYAAAKGGIAQMVKALSNEWSAKGIRVNAVVPGYIKTDMNSALLANPTRLRQISERIPAGRWGDPADFAGVVVFLASRASLYVCGELVVVDGGWMGR